MNHYIYAHLDQGEPVYVGIGEKDRAWKYTSRKPEHKAWLASKYPEDLEIQWIATGLTKSDAIMLETIIINQLKPRFNKMVGKPLTDGSKIYWSAKQAANLTGIKRCLLYTSPSPRDS